MIMELSRAEVAFVSDACLIRHPATFEKKREVAGKGGDGVNKRRFEAAAPGFAACSLTKSQCRPAGRPNPRDVAVMVNSQALGTRSNKQWRRAKLEAGFYNIIRYGSIVHKQLSSPSIAGAVN